MKTLLKVLSYINLVLGLIGSFILANKFGKSVSLYSYYSSKVIYERNWALTLGIFGAGILSTLVLFSILYALSEILDAQERLYSATYKMSAPSTSMNSNTESAPIHAATPALSASEWVCPKCGKHNSSYVGTCGCGERKPN